MNKQHNAQRGLTLIETSAALAIAAILATGAVSGLAEVLEHRRLEGVAAELASDLQFVRSEAVARNQGVRISFASVPGGASCYLIHTGAAADCACSASGPAHCAAPAQLIKAVQAPGGGRVQVQANAGSILFHPVRGTTSPTASITIAGADGPALKHVVSVLGRVRTCAPEGGLPGYRAC